MSRTAAVSTMLRMVKRLMALSCHMPKKFQPCSTQRSNRKRDRQHHGVEPSNRLLPSPTQLTNLGYTASTVGAADGICVAATVLIASVVSSLAGLNIRQFSNMARRISFNKCEFNAYGFKG